MCGIFGWQLNRRVISKNQVSILSALLAHGNDNRGGDSWGFVEPGQPVIRGLGDLTLNAWRMGGVYNMMAHTRKGTTGKVCVENSHPFEIGNLVGVHNGMISNHGELNTKHGRNHDVDSMHIFSHLVEGKPLSELTGYGMIVYYYKDNPGSMLLSNIKSGDISVRQVGPNGAGGAVFSSKDDHLKRALAAAGIESHEHGYKVEQGKTYELKGGVLYETSLPVNELASWRETDRAKPMTSGGYSSYSHYTGYRGFSGDEWDNSRWDKDLGAWIDGDADMMLGADGKWKEIAKKKMKKKNKPTRQYSIAPVGEDHKDSITRDAYELACHKFWEFVVAEDLAEPEDMPLWIEWQALTDKERAILVREDASTVLDVDYTDWLYEKAFTANGTGDRWFSEWLKTADFSNTKDTDEQAVALAEAVDSVTRALGRESDKKNNETHPVQPNVQRQLALAEKV